MTAVPAVTVPTTPAGLTAPRSAAERLLDETRAFISRFWIAPSEAALDAMVLWAAHTHAVGPEGRLVFEATPRLMFASTGPASGKSTALNLLELLSGRGARLADPTAPAMLAMISQNQSTLLIDELDTLFGRGAGGRSTRTIMLDGYTSGGTVPRVVAGEPRLVSCFAPMAYAGMRQNFMSHPKLEALRTRTIMITCRPRTTTQPVESYRRRLHAPSAVALNAALAKWGRAHAGAMTESWPEPPEGVADRAADLWEPLLAVGEVAGGTWAVRARTACRVLALDEPEESDDPSSPLEMLLADLARVWEPGEERLASRTLVERLAALPGSGWRRFPSPQAAGREIAAILEPLGVAPAPVWLDGMTVRGYAWADVSEHLPAQAMVELPADVEAVEDLPW